MQPSRAPDPARPHIVLLAPRGEAFRNFVYSETLPRLARQARVTLLSVVDDDRVLAPAQAYVDRIAMLESYPENRLVTALRYLTHTAHYRWLWSQVAQNLWQWRDAVADRGWPWIRRRAWNAMVRACANRPTLELLTALDRHWSVWLRPTRDLDRIFERLGPQLVFNCSHIHGPAADLPIRIAHRSGIATAGFIFSWDNLTSRSRIFPPYDHYLVWNRGMRDQLLSMYPRIRPEQVHITGSPQFDFHFQPQYRLSRAELCRRIGADPERPFILYTTGMAEHFPEEHRTVEYIARLLPELEHRPQLVVRTYIKDTSRDMSELAARRLPDVLFPEVLWERRWFTPLPEDLKVYTSLLHHAAVGINAASTVSLELLMLDKPVINLGFDPPGSRIPFYFRWRRHLEFDHYRPVVESGAVAVADRPEEMLPLLHQALAEPQRLSSQRRAFIEAMFHHLNDGHCGARVADRLLDLARDRKPRSV